MSNSSARKRVLFYGSAILAGILTSGTWLYGSLTFEGSKRQITNGPWFTSELYGASTADPFTRTTVALSGLFALEKQETIYYTSVTDSAGGLLSANCDYRVEGRPFASRWWSITLYGADHYLVQNEINRYAFNMKNLNIDPDGGFTINISSKKKAVNWLPSSSNTLAGKKFSLTLRLYNPEESVFSNLRQTPLPKIIKEGCR